MEQKVKIISIIISVLFFAELAISQSISTFVLSPAGTSKTNSGYSISYTVGQVVSESSFNQKILTQGFEQPAKSRFLKLETDDMVISNVKLFPNPFIDYLTVSFIDNKLQQNFMVQVYNSLGQIQTVTSENESNGKMVRYKINFSTLAAGQYIIRFVNATKSGSVLSFKVIKQL